MGNQKYFEEFITATRRVAKHDLVLCGSGNLSWRVADGNVLVTATNSWMGNITKDEVAVCRIADGATLNGKKPSKEIGFHTAILRERQDVNVVLHFQSPCATSIACMDPQVTNFFVIPEIAYYIGSVSVVPYLLPGSPEFAEAVSAAIKKHDLAILRNHGQVTVGRNFDEVIENATYFELACKIILKAGGDVQRLSREAVADLRRMREANRSMLCT
ncbi:MAG: class II aldolase/adducin family protein [Desulfosarcina sp.]|nr:class II aldolase/adducin family protein [Desulfobacterales bacterium]